MSNPQHLAEPSFRAAVIDAFYAAKFGPNTPDRNGKHRKWNAVKVRPANRPEACLPCDRMALARKRAES